MYRGSAAERPTAELRGTTGRARNTARELHAARANALRWLRCVARAPVHRRGAHESAPVECKAKHGLRIVRDALGEGIKGDEGHGRETQADRKRRQRQQHRQARRELRAQEAQRLRHRESTRGKRTVARALDAAVDVTIPEIVDRAARAAHGESSHAKQRQQRRVGQRTRRRRQRGAPEARPEEQPCANGPIPAA